MILTPDFERRTVEDVRRFLDDIEQCDKAEITVTFQGQAPVLRFVFGDPSERARPLLVVNLVAQSRQNPLAPGRLLTGDALRRVVREWVEQYFKLQGVPLSKKVLHHAAV